ncbi:Rtg3p [Lachancea thermotolerans CBS 6340]|uniref:KLTH0C05544p n=1 Tax=Lachancea thermotolerans (strain ATCC 56472 / CBS 6340 / NRRL Y-8284) TaxID=559295 RepID=C5DE17_LACTC|nr:KLTH0C05544p [Lachancea thermotolerans CBS 6340]CAR22028.1 KLTH0C05544p [Lachancea thermotolerans CBS 6340]
MEFQQDENDFINELLGHAGLGELTATTQPASEALDPGGSFEAAGRAPGFEQVHMRHPYAGSTPAKQQELLQRREQQDLGSYGSEFLIDEHLAQAQANAFFQESFQDPPHASSFQNEVQEDHLSRLAEDPVSSLGSSVATSDFLSPSTSFSFHSQGPLDSVDSPSYSQYLSSSLRSPSNSFRQGNYLSTSLRAQQLNPRFSSVGSTAANTPGDLGNSSALSQEEKLRRRREFHNAVERRRRELIKQKVKELSKMIPPSLLNYNEQGKEIKANKGVILNRSVDYMDYLQQVLEIQDRKHQFLLKKVRELESFQHAMNTSRSRGPASKNTASDSPDQVIDTRGAPVAGENSSSTPSTTFQDDLQQFLSGDIIEAEDNAKLMFGGEGEGTAADFLLSFGK